MKAGLDGQTAVGTQRLVKLQFNEKVPTVCPEVPLFWWLWIEIRLHRNEGSLLFQSISSGFRIAITTSLNEMIKTILIVDQDLGFVFWLGQTLDRAGYNAIPARSVGDALQLLEQGFYSVDLLVLNPELADAGNLIGLLRRKDAQVKLVEAWESEGQYTASDPRADTWMAKPRTFDDAARLKWIDAIRQTLGRVRQVIPFPLAVSWLA